MKKLTLVASSTLLALNLTACSKEPEQKPESPIKKLTCKKTWVHQDDDGLIDTAVITFYINKSEFHLKNPVAT
jgi:PBP1b-binding outer membrane lipoprotein LpoB